MKTAIHIFISLTFLLLLQFKQVDTSYAYLGEGKIYLKENRILKDIRLREIKEFWIIYEKDGNLHDLSIENIKKIEFPQTSKGPKVMTFDRNRPVIKCLKNS